jgi:ribonuclease R
MVKKTRKKALSKLDPHAKREASKYESPIPSREYILQFLEERGECLKREQIAEGLGLQTEDDIEALRRRLRAMERDGQLIYTRRGLAPVDKLDLVRGRVTGHPDGFGFLIPDEGGEDLFLSPRVMSGVMHGDRAVAQVTGIDRRGRREGAIVEVLERAHHKIVGRYYFESGVGFVVADNKRIPQDIMVPQDKTGGAKNGQFVVVKIIEHPTSFRRAIGQVIEIMGDHMAPGMEIDVAIRSYDIPCEWPDAVEEEIKDYGKQVPEDAKQGRTDLRKLPLVTIDGEDARDFDDAVYCERKGKGWRLLVAIADVSHYVQPGSALDMEARERGTSVYFPERVVPMLPEVLSNGLCSINPDVDRLCMVCEMTIDDVGKVTRSRFIEGVMRSHARLTYNKVAAMLVDQDPGLRSQYKSIVPHLDELYALFKVLRKARDNRGTIDFDTTETRIVFGKDRKIERIVPVQRNDAHMLIEECMIAANVCAARFLLRNKIPALYRVHEVPGEEKITDLREFLGELGLQLKGGDQPEPKHFAEVLKQVRGRPDAHLIQTVMLRSLKQAQYSPDNIGHFGLAHDAYAHFTSPIRRYPDLLVHRAIRHLLRHGKVHEFDYGHEDMMSFGEHCSMTGRRADEATRDAVDWLKCEYMMDKVGEEFEGIITTVTSFGIFVELDQIYVEGLVHITALANDYFHFEPTGHRLMGERTGMIYRLGDMVRVQVVRVDLDERKIDFQLADAEAIPGKKKQGARHATTRKKSAGRRKSTGRKKTSTRKNSPASDKKAVAKKKTSDGKGSSSKKKTQMKKKKTTAKKKSPVKKKTGTRRKKIQTRKRST